MPEQTYRVGVDLGGTNIKVGVLDEAGLLLTKKSCKTRPYERPWQAVAADMAQLIREVLAELDVGESQVQKIGIGSPGMIDHIGGVVKFAGNFDWFEVPLVEELGRYFSVPIGCSQGW